MKFLNGCPLWFVILFWLVTPRRPAINSQDLAQQMVLLDEMNGALPVPGTFLEEWIITRMLTWIDEQQREIHQLAKLFGTLNIVALGVARR